MYKQTLFERRLTHTPTNTPQVCSSVTLSLNNPFVGGIVSRVSKPQITSSMRFLLHNTGEQVLRRVPVIMC